MIDKWLETLKDGKCLTEREVKILCEKVNKPITTGQRNPHRRIKRSTCQCPSNHLRRYSWTVL
jgi:hypothetical protein